MVSGIMDREGIFCWAELVTEATLETWGGHVFGLNVSRDPGPIFGSEVTICTLKLATTIFVDP